MVNECGRIEDSDGQYFVNGKFLCSVLGLSKGRVSQLVSEGVLSKEDTAEYGPMFNLIDSIQEYWSRKQTKETEEDRKIRVERTKAEASIKQSKAQIAKLEAQELQGKMFRYEDVKAITEDRFYEIRSQINALHGRLATEVAGSDNPAECAAIIRTVINEMLIRLQQYRFDPTQYYERIRERKKLEASINGSGYDDAFSD